MKRVPENGHDRHHHHPNEEYLVHSFFPALPHSDDMILEEVFVRHFTKLGNILPLTLVCRRWHQILTVPRLLKELLVVFDLKIRDDSFGKLTALTYLDFGNNRDITDASLSHLTALTHLNLGWNTNITDKSISLLTALTELHLGRNNQITHASLGKLTALTYLHLGRNKNITDVSTFELTGLKILPFLIMEEVC